MNYYVHNASTVLTNDRLPPSTAIHHIRLYCVRVFYFLVSCLPLIYRFPPKYGRDRTSSRSSQSVNHRCGWWEELSSRRSIILFIMITSSVDHHNCMMPMEMSLATESKLFLGMWFSPCYWLPTKSRRWRIRALRASLSIVGQGDDSICGQNIIWKLSRIYPQTRSALLLLPGSGFKLLVIVWLSLVVMVVETFAVDASDHVKLIVDAVESPQSPCTA